MVGSLSISSHGCIAYALPCTCTDAGVTKGMAFGFELIITFVLVSLANESSELLQKV